MRSIVASQLQHHGLSLEPTLLYVFSFHVGLCVLLFSSVVSFQNIQVCRIALQILLYLIFVPDIKGLKHLKGINLAASESD